MDVCSMCDHCEYRDHWYGSEVGRDWLRPDYVEMFCRQSKRKCSSTFDCEPSGLNRWEYARGND